MTTKAEQKQAAHLMRFVVSAIERAEQYRADAAALPKGSAKNALRRAMAAASEDECKTLYSAGYYLSFWGATMPQKLSSRCFAVRLGLSLVGTD